MFGGQTRRCVAIHHFIIDNENNRDDRLIGYTVDVEASPYFEPDIPALCDWGQIIALGVLDDVWTHNNLLEESVHIRITNHDQIVIIDTIKNRKPIDAA